MDQSIRIPTFLHELHGKTARPIDLILTYSLAAIGALVVALVPELRPEGAWWQKTLAAVIAADLFGGVVANFTSGTDAHYAASRRRQRVFLLIHVIQPTVLWISYGGLAVGWAAISAAVIISAFLVHGIRGRKTQEPVAAVLVGVIVVAAFVLKPTPDTAAWFGPVFALKLVLAFAVRRTGD